MSCEERDNMNEDVGVMIVFWISFMVILLVTELSAKWKSVGILACWIGLGLSIAYLYPDEFCDFILGDGI